MTMTPEDLIDELWRKVVLAPDEPELQAALDELQSALQKTPRLPGECGCRLLLKPSSRYPETVKHTPRKDRRLIFLAAGKLFGGEAVLTHCGLLSGTCNSGRQRRQEDRAWHSLLKFSVRLSH
jgi:hypothetical protein